LSKRKSDGIEGRDASSGMSLKYIYKMKRRRRQISLKEKRREMAESFVQ